MVPQRQACLSLYIVPVTNLVPRVSIFQIEVTSSYAYRALQQSLLHMTLRLTNLAK